MEILSIFKVNLNKVALYIGSLTFKQKLLVINLTEIFSFFFSGSPSHRVTRSHRFAYARKGMYSPAIAGQPIHLYIHYISQSIDVRLREVFLKNYHNISFYKPHFK